MASETDQLGCLHGCGGHGCAAVVFCVLLLSVLMVEHAFHIFEGALWMVAGVLALGAAVMGAWQIVRWVLLRIARRMPDQPRQGESEAP